MRGLSARTLGAVALTIGTAALTAACGSSSSSGGGSAATTTPSTSGKISLLTYTAENGAWNPMLKAFAATDPKISVNHETQEPTEYPALLATRIRAGNAPSVFRVIGGLGFSDSVQTLAASGTLKDLSGEPWAKGLPASVASPYEYDGKLYALPLGISLQDVLWNDGLMKKLGLQIPTTISQLVDVCHAAKAKGLVTMAVTGPAAATFAGEIAANTVYASQTNWNQLREAGKVTFAGSAGWNEALQQVAELKQAGCFSPDAISDSITAAIGQWVGGQALSFPAPSFAQSAAPKLDVVQAPFPAVTASDQRVVEYSGQAVAASNTASGAAISLINSFATVPQEARFAAGQAGTVATASIAHKQYPANWKQYIAPLLNSGKVTATPSQEWKSPNVATDLSKAVQGVLGGSESIKQALTTMDQDWNS